jgi:hypothetical protein
MEKLGICISLLDVGNAGAFFFPCTLDDGKRDDLSFEPCSKISLVGGKPSIFLRQVKEKNHKGGMHHDLGVGEKPVALSGKGSTRVA